MIRSTRVPVLLFAAALPAFAAASAPELPAVYPLCTTPQMIAPVSSPQIGGSNFARESVAWDGREFAVLWPDNAPALRFAKVFGDGSIRSTTTLAPGFTPTQSAAAIAWDGTNYAVAALGRGTGDTFDQVFFFKVTRDGVVTGPVTRVSFVGTLQTVNTANPALAVNSQGYGIFWNDARGTAGQDIYATYLDSAGAIRNAGAAHDMVLSPPGGPGTVDDQIAPVAIALQDVSAYGFMLVVWQTRQSGVRWELASALIDPIGSPVTGVNIIASGAGDATQPALAGKNSGAGLTWSDTRDGNSEIYFEAITDTGGALIAPLRITSDPALSLTPRILWTGGEFEILWRDTRASQGIWWQRVSDAGTPVNANQQINALTPSDFPDFAFNGSTFLVTTRNNSGFYWPKMAAIGCSADVTPPSCSGNYLAYSITGTTASFSWTPATDAESGVAYYQVYRNNTPLAKTSDNFYNDSGLTLNTTYNYLVQPVNATQLQNGSCWSSVYTKTSASLTLLVNKSAPDALLNWNDAGLNNYNIFRGTDPRVMSQVGSTSSLSATDGNALNNAVSYFYTVDDPGI